MPDWLRSTRTAVFIGAMALLSELWRAFLDAMFVFPVDFGDPTLMNVAAAVFTVLFGAWGWSLAAAGRGSRGGLVWAFGLNLVVLLAIPTSWLLFYCPAACRAEVGIFNVVNSLNLILGALAALALGVKLLDSNSQQTDVKPIIDFVEGGG